MFSAKRVCVFVCVCVCVCLYVCVCVSVCECVFVQYIIVHNVEQLLILLELCGLNLISAILLHVTGCLMCKNPLRKYCCSQGSLSALPLTEEKDFREFCRTSKHAEPC